MARLWEQTFALPDSIPTNVWLGSADRKGDHGNGGPQGRLAGGIGPLEWDVTRNVMANPSPI